MDGEAWKAAVHGVAETTEQAHMDEIALQCCVSFC